MAKKKLTKKTVFKAKEIANVKKNLEAVLKEEVGLIVVLYPNATGGMGLTTLGCVPKEAILKVCLALTKKII